MKLLLPLALIAIALPLAAAPGHAASTHVVLISEYVYTPPAIVVSAGDTVVWVNVGAKQHEVTENTFTWTSGVLNPGDTYARTFPAVGAVGYHCVLYVFSGNAMAGAVFV